MASRWTLQKARWRSLNLLLLERHSWRSGGRGELEFTANRARGGRSVVGLFVDLTHIVARSLYLCPYITAPSPTGSVLDVVVNNTILLQYMTKPTLDTRYTRQDEDGYKKTIYVAEMMMMAQERKMRHI